MTVRTVFLAVLLALGGGTALAPAAFAQHVVTDDEAGKLTFDALTAAPRPVVRHVVFHPSYRPAYRVADYTRAAGRGFGRGYGRGAAVVQTVSYRRLAHAAPVHAAASHLAVAHRRRRG